MPALNTVTPPHGLTAKKKNALVGTMCDRIVLAIALLASIQRVEVRYL
ncbi:hypothetical protein CBM2634_P170008 [Cupriavidus taiwanensis]|uniref:Uncharacterized protein n=1 Tax=Cupriavidus taiwanensis TaxID=164546 RepID=A0A375JBQ8_9BURK|nr:hypothetical protein CBM2634_P170008 [Cupriavidus taiwanensis]